MKAYGAIRRPGAGSFLDCGSSRKIRVESSSRWNAHYETEFLIFINISKERGMVTAIVTSVLNDSD
jgi:hypothetical protein